jgi:Na+-driven multidrug efflux pump
MHRNFTVEGEQEKVMRQMAWPAILSMGLYDLNSFSDGVFSGHLKDCTAVAVAFLSDQLELGSGSLTGAGSAKISVSLRKSAKEVKYGTVSL